MVINEAHRPDFDSLSLFVLVLFVRAILIGLAPYADEGHYAATSYFQFHGYTDGLFSEGTAIPNFGGIELYPLLVSWVYAVPAEPYFLLRVADGIFAAFAGVMIYKYLCLVVNHRLPAYLATIMVIVAINHPEFIEAGARNPIPIATLALFSALYVLERYHGKILLLPASCLAAAVLFREPFLPLAGVVVLHVWQQRDFRTAVKLCGLTAVFGALVIVFVAALKGGVGATASMYDAYVSYTNPEFNLTLFKRIERAAAHAKQVFLLLPFCIPVLLLGVFAPLFESSLRNRKVLSFYSLGLLLALAPLVEVLVKKPYSYHLSQMFFGAGILASYGFFTLFLFIRKFHEYRQMASMLLVSVVMLIHLYWFKDYVQIMRYAAGWSINFSPVTVFGDWSSPVVRDSYYLQIASIVRQNSKPGDVILSTSYNIYPLAGRIPLSRQSASLAGYRSLVKSRNVDEDIISMIHERKPMIFIDEKSLLLPVDGQRDDFDQKISALYQTKINVGPDLSPYRQFYANVYISPNLH